MNWELQLSRPVRTRKGDLPEVVRTLGDAIDMIDENLNGNPCSFEAWFAAQPARVHPDQSIKKRFLFGCHFFKIDQAIRPFQFVAQRKGAGPTV